MANETETVPRPSRVRSTSPRTVVGTYSDYADAQRAVDRLSDEEFPVERTAIVAEGLSFVEQVTGRLNWWKAALNGTITGGVIGLFVGFLLGILAVEAEAVLNLSLWGLVIGAVIGAIVGLIGYGVSGGHRDFTSVGAMQAERYLVMADADVADDARALLESAPPPGR